MVWRLALIPVTLTGLACSGDEPTRQEALGAVYVLQSVGGTMPYALGLPGHTTSELIGGTLRFDPSAGGSTPPAALDTRQYHFANEFTDVVEGRTFPRTYSRSGTRIILHYEAAIFGRSADTGYVTGGEVRVRSFVHDSDPLVIEEFIYEKQQ
jgi:hypothetical protein